MEYSFKIQTTYLYYFIIKNFSFHSCRYTYIYIYIHDAIKAPPKLIHNKLPKTIKKKKSQDDNNNARFLLLFMPFKYEV